MSVFNRQAKRLNGVAEVLHKGFLEALEVQVNRMAGKRRGVMYMRVQSLAHGIAQVEYFSKGKVDDTVLYYDTRLHAPDGEANLSERIVGAWHLPQWGEADLSQFELLATQARVQTLNDPVRFYEPGELKPMEFTIKKAA